MSLRIAIVGGGLAGLSLAAWLQRRGQACTVFEASDGAAPREGELPLSPEGVALLRELIEVPEASLLPVLPLRVVSHSARSLLTLDDTQGPLLAQQRVSHAAVHARLREALPSGVVREGSRVIAVAQPREAVVLGLEGGAEVEVDLVVGADGAGSTIRAQLWGEVPAFQDLVAIQGVTGPGEALPLGVSGALRVLGDGCSLHAIQPVSLGPIAWQFSRRGERDALSRMTPGQLRDEVAFLTSEWAMDVRPLVECTDDAALSGSAILAHELPARLSLGAATLIGEAAHAVPRRMDLGATRTLHEAKALAEALEGATRVTLPMRQAAYEQAVRAALEGDVTRALWNAKFFHLTGPFARFLRDSGMRLLESGMQQAETRSLPPSGSQS